jgi:DNA replication protein DnaC
VKIADMSLPARLRLAQIPVTHANATLDTYRTPPGDAEALELVEGWVEDVAISVAEGRGLFLQGTPGTGKTHLAVAALLGALKAGHSGLFITLQSLVRLCMRQFDLQRQEDDERLAQVRSFLKLARLDVDVLVLDDVGRERQSPSKYVDDEIDFLLRSRGSAGKVTIITSNLPIEDWGERYSKPIKSYIHEICTIVKFEGKDYRRGKR